MWTEITTLADLKIRNLLECHKFVSVDWHKVKVKSKFHQICKLSTVNTVDNSYTTCV